MLPSTSSSSSGLSVRPASSLSVPRPPSSASNRPHSRLSIRSQNSRHARSRLVPLCQTLVTQVTGLRDGKDTEEEDFRTAVEFAVKNLEATTLSKGAVSVDMGVMDRQIRGHAQKARINSQDELGEALETCYQDLKAHFEEENDLDQEIKKSRLPDHLQFLVKLSSAPSSLTTAYASSYLHNRAHPLPAPVPLTWAAIVAEEPFEGEHWEGVYGLPPGFVRQSRISDKGEKGGKHYDREKESERLDWDSRWSTPSLSPLNSGDLELDEDDEDDSFDEVPPIVGTEESAHQEDEHSQLQGKRYREPPHTYAHRREVEALKSKQYWREDWKGDSPPMTGKKAFNIGDASTLGPTLNTVLRPANAESQSFDIPLDVLFQNERYINEEDAVREVLMSLQGRKNIIFSWNDNDGAGEGIYTMTQAAPRLIHLSLASQASIFSSLARSATTIQQLRNFVGIVFKQTQDCYLANKLAGKRKPAMTRTLEAFADAVDAEIIKLDRWCAQREEAMCRAWGGVGVQHGGEGDNTQKLVISLLGTENDLQVAFERTFDVLLDIVREVYPSTLSIANTTITKSKSPATLTAILLDGLFAKVQEHLERQEGVTSEALMRVFVRTAEPIWAMIGRWLRDGMGSGIGAGMENGAGTAGKWGELDDEFFIESSGLGLGIMGLGLLDSEFWKEGYTLREGAFVGVNNGEGDSEQQTRKTIPMFLEHVAEPILQAGKAVGLLRALGIPSSHIMPASGWKSFQELVGLSSCPGPGTETAQSTGMLFSVSIDTLSRLIYDGLLPQCDSAGSLLARVLVNECSLWSHLGAIEDLFLLRRGDAMSHFIDVLFAKMDTQQSWADFHFLNTAFRDVVESNTNVGAKVWIQTPLVRLSYRGSKDKDKSVSRTVKAIDGLVVEYAVPFPLTYIFQPAALSVYGEILVFLLQIRRAKGVLDRILVRGEGSTEKLKGETKAFYAMRSRLSWFINTLLNFLTTYVIHSQIMVFHDIFRAAGSLDRMIQLHDEHLDKIKGRCLLKPHTSSLHRAILSILDMALHFSGLVAFVGDTTRSFDTSRLSSSMKRHRSRRQRRQRRNIISFSQSIQESYDSSEDDDDDIPDMDGASATEPSFSTTASMSYTDEGFNIRMDKMSSELDGLVRFLRRGVESLAGGIGEAAGAFGVLAFALEDWDS